MRTETAAIHGIQIPVYSANTLIIGSGAAALKAALSLHERGQRDIAIMTEKWGGGTSNNSGSDKQTYYKLSLAGNLADSPMEMARDLFQGGCMHGDIALCEAQHSTQAFYDLVGAGVPFPHDRFGGYPGYRTDHDPRGRATSAGPRTSHFMFQALARRARSAGIPIFDRHQVIALFTLEQGSTRLVIGAAALNLDRLDQEGSGLVLFNAVNVVLGTGGPGGLYETSVYPPDQTGAIALALEAGAVAHNLTESQFGLASIRPRWNVSGSYQQVIPRYLSTDPMGGGERDFLASYFPDLETMTLAIFRKGYQWPFDPRKIAGFGSSLVDLAVYQETVLRGRRVFLDFIHNPCGPAGSASFKTAEIPGEAAQYLRNSRALQPAPIERLECLNPQAIQLYRDHGIDLAAEPLEIAVCAQHNNGGLRANHWWESNLQHLFPVGEVNGTHGVYRPGGAALNAGQVGGLRAAIFIDRKYRDHPPELEYFLSHTGTQIDELFRKMRAWLSGPARPAGQPPERFLSELRRRMTRHGAHVRDPREIAGAIKSAWQTLAEFDEHAAIPGGTGLPQAFKIRELALTHAVYLEAIGEYVARGGQSRGSYLIPADDGEQTGGTPGNEVRFSISKEDAFVSRHILELSLDGGSRLDRQWVPVRPIPAVDSWFENVWRDYLDGKTFE
jgi:succinate dehydrogenase/fumarate reductase flavoprotein subunit